jgi:NuA3 HAT complex component NTO1
MVFCDGCNAIAHQSCYGREIFKRLPRQNQNWFCERCKYLNKTNKKPIHIKCIFCPDRKGMMLLTEIGWAHITCVNWLPEIWYKNEKENLKFNLNGKINEKRKGLMCYVCKDTDGYCLHCDFKDCDKNFHI